MEAVMVRGYDKLALNDNLLLDLPFEEGVGGDGTLTRDVARSHHPVVMTDAPAWAQTPNNLTYLDYAGLGHYLECPAADTIDLDFTTGDYSIGAWLLIVNTGVDQIVTGRYGLDADGWEVYLFDQVFTGYLQLRHHHVSLAPNTRDGCYSVGWFPTGEWVLMGISRSGLYPIHYRNGVPLPMSYEVTGMLDPDSANRDLVIGTRYTKNANWYGGGMRKPRIWGRCLTAEDWQSLFEIEREYYGV